MKLALSGNTKLIYMYMYSMKAEEWLTMKQIVDTLTNLITDAELILYSNIHIIYIYSGNSQKIPKMF